MNIEKQYLNILSEIMRVGEFKEDRTSVGCLSVWGVSMRHHMSKGFPLITTKKMWFKGIVTELFWMLRGDQNISFLEEHGTAGIWAPWATKEGDLGPIYGPSWRNWNSSGLDQIKSVINQIKKNPESRRHLVLAWNPSAVWSGEAKLPPCHIAFQLQVMGEELNCNWMMRSSDAFLGLPWNLAFYGILHSMIAQCCGLKPGTLTYWGNDVHIYSNHFQQATEQLRRDLKPLPKLWLNPDIKDIDDFGFEDVKIKNYEFWPAIKAPLAV